MNLIDSKYKISYYTLGCKLNFSETSTITRSLEDISEEVKFDDNPDIYVFNTCSVTEKADQKLKYLVNKGLRVNPNAFIVVVGCYAQLKPEEISNLKGVDLVLGAGEKFEIKKYLDDIRKKETGEFHSCAINEVNSYISSYSYGSRARAFLKVQDGCDYKCTYCTIPLARGISRSDTVENILKQAEELSEKGVKEIVLTGVNIGDYGKGEFGNKKHEHTFLELIQALDKETTIERFRISSIEPNLLTDEVIEFVSKSRAFVPHFHIPLQSGSNKILGKMKRRYKRELYVDRVSKIKSLMPNCSIGVDVIVGFPSETEDLFMETYEFINNLDISYLHVFSFSRRANTEADLMEGQVSLEKKKMRSQMLRILSQKKSRAFYSNQLGSHQEVLFENENKEGFLYGYTKNYLRIKVPFEENLTNQKAMTSIEKIDSDGTIPFKEFTPTYA